MKGPPMIRAISLARKCTCSSFSMTHGPAIKNNGASAPISSPDAMRTRLLGLLRGALAAFALLERRPDERLEERMRLERLRLEFGGELAGQEPGVVTQLATLAL